MSDPHPNTYRLTLSNQRETHSIIAISTGEGMMEVLSIDGVSMLIDGGYHETLISLPKDIMVRFEADEVIQHHRGDATLWQIKSNTFVPPESLDSLSPISVKRLFPVLPVPSRQECGRRRWQKNSI